MSKKGRREACDQGQVDRWFCGGSVHQEEGHDHEGGGSTVGASRTIGVVGQRSKLSERNQNVRLTCLKGDILALAPSSFLDPFSSVLEFVCLPWSEVCSARVTSLLLLLLLLLTPTSMPPAGDEQAKLKT